MSDESPWQKGRRARAEKKKAQRRTRYVAAAEAYKMSDECARCGKDYGDHYGRRCVNDPASELFRKAVVK